MQIKKQKKKEMSDAHLMEASRLFGILSEPSRLRLLRELMRGDATVTELMEATGMKQGNVSKHLGVLLDAHFVGREQVGNFARYTLTDSKVYQLCQLMCERIEQDITERFKVFAPSESS